MQCSRCNAPKPTIHVTAKVGDAFVEMSFCVSCAPGPQMVIEQIPTTNMIRCPRCGTSVADLQESGRFGCADDYEIFASAITKGLKKYHGASRHVGKIPSKEKHSA